MSIKLQAVNYQSKIPECLNLGEDAVLCSRVRLWSDEVIRSSPELYSEIRCGCQESLGTGNPSCPVVKALFGRVEKHPRPVVWECVSLIVDELDERSISDEVGSVKPETSDNESIPDYSREML